MIETTSSFIFCDNENSFFKFATHIMKTDAHNDESQQKFHFNKMIDPSKYEFETQNCDYHIWR